MRYFPFFFDLRGRSVLIVGGGEIARRKAELLARAGARLTVIAPRIAAELAALLAANNGEALRRAFRADDVRGRDFVVAATAADALNERVAAAAKAASAPVNVVDCPRLCDFIFPAIAERAPLIVAAASAGLSPVLARRARTLIETAIPRRFGALAAFAGRMRDAVKNKIADVRLRRIFWERALSGAIAERAMAGDDAAAERLLTAAADAAARGAPPRGEVYLIGAGPGGMDLLTLRALRLLQQADVVVFDRLVSAEIVELARRDAERIFVGKSRGRREMAQERICRLLVAKAKAGLRVARLKGGDPLIFGRGGEEAAALAAAEVPFEIAAGVTAASACAAAARIPLTQRAVAGAVRLIAAHDDLDAAHWRRLAADDKTTAVFYMAGARLAAVCRNLIAAGRAAAAPAALICRAGLSGETVIAATLATLPLRAAGRVASPALLIVGEVVALRAAQAETGQAEIAAVQAETNAEIFNRELVA